MKSETKKTDYDVIVVGAGNGALVGALSAHEMGADVAVLEVAPRESRGGNCYFTGGGFRVPLKGLAEFRELVPDVSDAEAKLMDVDPYTADQFYNIWMRLSDGLADPELVEKVITNANPTIRWMGQQGVVWEPYVVRAVQVKGRYKWVPGNIVIGAKGEGAGLSDMLFDSVEKRGIDVHYETKAIKLLVDSKGRVCGVTVKDNEGFRDIRSRAVILACGGFESNREMRAKYLGSIWELARGRGTRFNMGVGIKMALEIGAQPAGQWSKCHGTVIDSKAPCFGDPAMGDKTSRGSYPYGIMVNIHGERFADEGEDIRQFTYAKMGEAALMQPQGLAFQIFDSTVDETLFEARYKHSSSTKANSFKELAEKLGINASSLIKTVDEYNAAVQEGPYDPLKKDGKHTVGIHPPKTNWAKKLESPPFLAYSVTGGITFSYGGIKINTNAQVIDTENKVIPGLYAAGEIVGGLFYHNYPGGTCLMAGAVFGRLAGIGAAQE
ncbi:MAG: FAD-dependent tricarballylate dehydrogenase TcuA [Thermodesulfobacteriota bacterium]|nr:FAD-dependent tricarballylate dehydrogenase TcuA [Thermodesulfobacteriota bacterium]